MTPAFFPPSVWTPLNRLQGEMERLLGRLGSGAREAAGLTPPVNLWEDAEAFHVEAELPGVAPDRVEVSVTADNELTVRGERRPEAAPEGAWHRRECGSGRFERVLALPLPVDAGRVEARLEHGVLHVTLPKAEAVKPRKITVRAD
jgi:HSP20 family protein